MIGSNKWFRCSDNVLGKKFASLFLGFHWTLKYRDSAPFNSRGSLEQGVVLRHFEFIHAPLTTLILPFQTTGNLMRTMPHNVQTLIRNVLNPHTLCDSCDLKGEKWNFIISASYQCQFGVVIILQYCLRLRA